MELWYFPSVLRLISSKRCQFLILATWIVAMAIHSPYLFGLKLAEIHGVLDCRWHWKEAFGESSYLQNYFLSFCVTFTFMPFVLIALLYIIIFFKLKSLRSPGEQSVNVEQQRQQRERNVLKTTIAVVLGFALCWLPFALGGFITILWDIRSCSFQYFFTVTLEQIAP